MVYCMDCTNSNDVESQTDHNNGITIHNDNDNDNLNKNKLKLVTRLSISISLLVIFLAIISNLRN